MESVNWTWILLLWNWYFETAHHITLFNLKKGLIGHWGQSGAFAFYHEDTDLFFTGTINEFTGHSVAAGMMMKLIKIMKD
ncbi:hypothetical protein MNQ98_17825 [Paenibacillus sp. N3/727]|uniref:hypothetical protein n=1 Tax=Paenibacillus sp. N3/727 TaxID=2925845 RepID=UPI001F53279E|nr:hypothetical protein [Paenibacillus sp. N3/727]UNK16373.1 hypothetical protein MNQ98_17825 [Paenibacillus sp. N3/727]